MPDKEEHSKRRALLLELIDRARLAYDAAEEAGEYKASHRLLSVIQRLARSLDGLGPVHRPPA